MEEADCRQAKKCEVFRAESPAFAYTVAIVWFVLFLSVLAFEVGDWQRILIAGILLGVWLLFLVTHSAGKMVIVDGVIVVLWLIRFRVIDACRELSGVERDRSRGIRLHLREGQRLSVAVRRQDIDRAVEAVERILQGHASERA